MDSNEASVSNSNDFNLCEQREADLSGVNMGNCLKSVENETKRLTSEYVKISEDLLQESDRVRVMKKYYNELCELMIIHQAPSAYTKETCEQIKIEINGSIDKIFLGLKSFEEVMHSICYLNSVFIIAQLLNREVEINGLGESQGIIRKVEISEQRLIKDIVIDCLQIIKVLKQRGTIDPMLEEIAERLLIEHQLNCREEEINAKLAEGKLEEERLIVEMNNLEQDIEQRKLEIVKMKEQAIQFEKSQKEKWLKLSYLYLEKFALFVTIGKKIDIMKFCIEEVLSKKTYKEVKEILETSAAKVVLLENEIELIKRNIKAI